ncbi:MAG: CHAT domain-containing tetratricopeptide repeat protein [Gemmatimonadales bacterium]
MIALLVALALVIPAKIAAQDPQEVESLRTLAKSGSDSALVERIRGRSNYAREALLRLFGEVASAKSDVAAESLLAAAQHLAGAVAVAWRDSFLLRQVERFRSLSAADRRTNVVADSLWGMGRAAFAQGNEPAMRLLRGALRRYEAVSDTSGMASALNGVAVGFQNLQQYDSALTYLGPAADYAEKIGDFRVWGGILGNLGNLRWRQGDLDQASESFAHARRLFERIGEPVGLRTTSNSFGLVAWSRGDLAGARRTFESGLAMTRRTHDSAGMGLFLSNLGGVEAEEGNYADATVHLQEAIAIYRAQENWLEVAATLPSLGEVKHRRGEYRSAIPLYEESLAILGRLGTEAVIYEGDEITVRSNLAGVRADMGDLQGARAELDRAEAFVRRLGGAEGRASLVELALTRGDIELRFNRLGEAERQYARAGRLAHGEATQQKRSQALIGLASVLLKRGSYARAQLALEQALAQRALDTHLTAMIRLLLGQAAWKRGDTATARVAFTQAMDTLRASGAVADEAEALGGIGDLEAGAGRPVAAESLYRRALTRLGSRTAPAVAWQLHAALAGSLRQRGALDDAVRELNRGIDEIERVSGQLQLEEHRSAFRADKWGVYVDLALVEHARGRAGAAFEASERLRARQMLDLLARGRVGDRQQLQQLSMREQDLRRRMGELTARTDSLAPAAAGPGAMRDPAPTETATGKELTRLQQEYGELLLQIREADPSYASLVRGEIVPARAVMAGLAPDEALLEYLVGDSTTLVFVVTADTLAAFDLGIDHEALAAQVDFARSALGGAKKGAAQRAWRPALRRLYQRLVEPAEASGVLAGKRRLIIAPHAELHYLPFAALVRTESAESLLIERYLIEYVPSASVWLKLRDRPQSQRAGGVLALAPRTKALPGSRAEVSAISRIYGKQAQTLVGDPATERAFRDLAPTQSVIHLATYGVLNKHNPLFSFVEMSPGQGDDGRLEVHEVFGLTLNARLLVLSACQTGLAAGELADVPPGDDWVGLVQGFLYAGVSNVLATLWPVADVATARLMERFYGELASGRPVAEALALAQRKALQDPATQHPFFWAGFALVRGR